MELISASSSCSSHISPQSLRCAVLGAGFAGLSVAWNLLQHSPKDLHLKVDMFDEVGVGGGASGVSGGLIHPYSPKVKLLWRGAECWNECLKLLRVAEDAIASKEPGWGTQECPQKSKGSIVRRRGILRPVTKLKNLDVSNENAQACLPSCRVELLNRDTAQTIIPDLFVPFDSAFYMPEAATINPQIYLQGLYSACQNLATEISALKLGRKEFVMYIQSIESLLDLTDAYDAVVICLGAKAKMLPELTGRLPLRTCRGVIANMMLPDDVREDYPDESPSILSDAWLAFHGPRSLRMGSTWEWGSTNYSSIVSAEEASSSLEELLPKASAIYPSLKYWNFNGAIAGLRAMPPLTPSGSLPLLGRVDEFISGSNKCKIWLIGGLGARGLLYHGWLGNLVAQAVIACDEDALPHELTSWKKSSGKRAQQS